MNRSLMLVPVLALSVLLTACGREVATTGPSTIPAVPSTVASAPGTTAAPTADAVEIGVAVKGSDVSPKPSVHEVKKGQTVRLTIQTDNADEVHVHGYDKAARTQPGKPVVIEFEADQTGRFEVETHESGLLLFHLQVS